MKFCLIWKQGILQKKYDFHKKKMKLLLAGDYEGDYEGVGGIPEPLFCQCNQLLCSLYLQKTH